MAPRLSAVCCSEKELKRRLSKSPYSMNFRGHSKSAFSRSKSQTPKKSSPASRTAQNKRISQHRKTIDPSEISLFSSTPSDAATGVASHAKTTPRKDDKRVKRADPSQISLFASTLSKNTATGAANHSHSSPSNNAQKELRSADDVVFRQTDFLSRYKSSFALLLRTVMEMGCGRDPLEDIDDFDHIFEDVLEHLEEER